MGKGKQLVMPQRFSHIMQCWAKLHPLNIAQAKAAFKGLQELPPSLPGYVSVLLHKPSSNNVSVFCSKGWCIPPHEIMEKFVKLINYLGKNAIYSVSIKRKHPKQ